MIVLLTLPAWTGAVSQDRVALLREQFQADRDAVHQAKNFPRLGDALLDEVRKQADAGDVTTALAAFEEYRNDLRHLLGSLKATGHNAEKQPAGFKELQIYLRKTLRNLDQLILLVPFERRAEFDAPRRDIGAIDEELFRLLFPRQPTPGAGGKPQGRLPPPGFSGGKEALAGGGTR